MSRSKLSSLALLILVCVSAIAGAFCLEYFVLSAPTENKNSPPALTLLPSVASSDRAAFVFDEPEADLGVVKEVVSHRFTYRNAGTTPLTITSVRPSCACVVSEPDRTTLQPDESGSITLEANVSQKQPGAHRLVLFVEYEWREGGCFQVSRNHLDSSDQAMRATFAYPCISLWSKRLLRLVVLSLPLVGTNEAKAGEKTHMRVAAVSASRRTCAAETLRFCLLLQGRDTPSLAEIEKRLSLGYEGVSAADMAELCRSLGVSIRSIKTTFEDLRYLSSPGILHVDDSHFIVFVKSEGDRLVLFDNMIGLFDCSRDWFHEYYQWHGTALVLGEHTSPLWFFLRSPWALSLAAGIFGIMCGLRLLFVRTAKQGVGVPLSAR